MIVRNEREHLADCLASLRDVVDESVVVDTGSTDGTQAIARQHGAKLIQDRWDDDFSRARNVALAAARGRWILVLDADEQLPAPEHAPLRDLLRAHTPPASPPATAFALVVKSSSDQGLTGALARLVRLFPSRPDVRYEYPIHEQVVTSLQRARLPILESNIQLLHSGYAQTERTLGKQRRNRQMLEAQIAGGREVSGLTYFLLGGACLDLDDLEAAVRAYREGQRRAEPGSEVARGSQVRLATGLVRLQRTEEARAGLPATAADCWHPELLVLHGECALAAGRKEEARGWFERVLAWPDGAFFPPCNLFAVKAQALLRLGQHWKDAGRVALGVELLRGALACRKAGVDFTPGRLHTLYAQQGVAPAAP